MFPKKSIQEMSKIELDNVKINKKIPEVFKVAKKATSNLFGHGFNIKLIFGRKSFRNRFLSFVSQIRLLCSFVFCFEDAVAGEFSLFGI